MSKYVRVMDGLKSNAGGFEYKLDEVNVAENWNPFEQDPEKMGGFNFGIEDKILRWLHRGDTIYDVIVPDDAEVILVNEDKGIYRSNKIIVSNPRLLTTDLIIDLYKKSTLSDKVLAQSMVALLWKNRDEVVKYIIDNGVNENNIEVIFNEFKDYAGEDNLKIDNIKYIYDLLLNIKGNYNK